MGFRFRRSIRLMPGMRINLSTRGASLTVGTRGASVNFGANGVFGTFGLPGTGMSWRERLSPGIASARPKRERVYTYQSTGEDDDLIESLGFDMDRFVRIAEEATALGGTKEAVVRFIHQRHREAAAEINQMLEDGINQHRKTPRTIERVDPAQLPEPDRAEWEAVYHGVEAGVPEDMAVELDRVLDGIDYFVETGVDYAIADDGRRLEVTVELPDFEAMPRRHFVAIKTQNALKGKFKSKPEQAREHATYIHGVAVRIVGAAFAALPSLDEVVCRGVLAGRDAVGPAAFSRDEWERVRPVETDPAAVFASARKPTDTGLQTDASGDDGIEDVAVEVDVVYGEAVETVATPEPAAPPEPVSSPEPAPAPHPAVTGRRPPRVRRSYDALAPGLAAAAEPPVPAAAPGIVISPKSRVLAVLLVVFLGCFGGHRFYVGRYVSGVLQLLTLGACGVWALFDLVQLVRGRFVDGDGLPVVG